MIAGANHIQVKLGASNTAYDATVVGTDPATDLALLKVNAPAGQLHPLPLGNSSKVEVGDPVVHAIRNREFFIFTHGVMRAGLQRRHERIMAAFDDLERYQAQPRGRMP